MRFWYWPPRKIRIAFFLLVLAAVALAAKAWSDTMADPQVQRTGVTLADYPLGAAPVTIALISDIHVAGPDMPPRRLERIVAQINALEPDLVLIAGDFVSDKRTATRHYTAQQAIAPLAALTPTIAAIAVPGNHDHWRDMQLIRRELGSVGVDILANQARAYGPLVIGGLDDDFTGRADIAGTLAQMEGLEGARLILSHSPDPFPDLPANIGLTLAGHTHCGQIAYPWGGAPAHLSDYGDRYGCGRVDEDGRVLVTGGGLGTSLLPFRLFTQPEVWLITVGPRL